MVFVKCDNHAVAAFAEPNQFPAAHEIGKEALDKRFSGVRVMVIFQSHHAISATHARIEAASTQASHGCGSGPYS